MNPIFRRVGAAVAALGLFASMAQAQSVTQYVDNAGNKVVVTPATPLPTTASVVGGGTTVKATAAAQPYTEGSTTGQLSVDLNGNLRVTGGGGGGAGTEYTEDAAAPANPVGGIGMCRRRDTLSAAEVSADLDVMAVNCSAKGQLHTLAEISNASLAVTGTFWQATQPVSGTFWQATQPVSIAATISQNLAQIGAVTIATGNGVVGTGVQRVAIASDNTAFTVNLGTLNGAATAANQVAGKNEDAVHASGDAGYPVWTVRTDTPAALSSATGDYAPFITDSLNRLWVNVGSCTGCGGGTQFAEDVAATSADVGTIAMAVRRDTPAGDTSANGDYGTLVLDSVNRLWVNVGADAVQGTTSDTCSSITILGALLCLKAAAADTTTVLPYKIDQTTPGTTNGVVVNAGTAIMGKVGIDQTTPGTTNGVRTDDSGATAAAVPARANYTGVNSGGNLVGLIQADTSAKLSISTATTTQVVALSSGKKVYITSFNFHAAGTTTTKLVYGTGTNCGTGTTDLTDIYDLTASDGMVVGGGIGPVLVAPASQAVCIFNSAAIHVGGSMAYTQF